MASKVDDDGDDDFLSLLPQPKHASSFFLQDEEDDGVLMTDSTSTMALAHGASSQAEQINEKVVNTLVRPLHDPQRRVLATRSDAEPQGLALFQGSLTLPNEEELAMEAAETEKAMQLILRSKLNPNLDLNRNSAQTASAKASTIKHSAERQISLATAQRDPLEPSHFRQKKAPPSGPLESAVPRLHAPASPGTSTEKTAWHVPPCISNWKNQKGYTIPLDKRVASNNPGPSTGKFNERMADFAEALSAAERSNREQVELRQIALQKSVNSNQFISDQLPRDSPRKDFVLSDRSFERSDRSRDRSFERSDRSSRYDDRFDRSRDRSRDEYDRRSDRPRDRYDDKSYDGRSDRSRDRYDDRSDRSRGRYDDRSDRSRGRYDDRSDRSRGRYDDRSDRSYERRSDQRERSHHQQQQQHQHQHQQIFDERLFDRNAGGISSGFGHDVEESFGVYDQPLLGPNKQSTSSHMIYRPQMAFSGSSSTVDTSKPVQFELRNEDKDSTEKSASKYPSTYGLKRQP